MAMLDTAIAVAFIFLMTAILVSSVNEFISGALQQRGKMLKHGISSLLGGADGILPNDKPLLEKIYEHAAITILRNKERLPSYIPAQQYSTALADTLVQSYQIVGKPVFHALPEAVRMLPDGDLKRSMSLLVDQSFGDPARLQALVEEQFNAVMDRVSGWYKRDAQKSMFIISMVVAVVLNIDTLHIAQHVYQSDALRARLVAQAELRVASVSTVGASDGGTGIASTPDVEKLRSDLKKLNELKLPIGWTTGCYPPCDDSAGETEEFTFWQHGVHGQRPTLSGGFLMIVGWIVTALAASLGAPYWFDTLSRLISVRGAGIKPARAEDQGMASPSIAVAAPVSPTPSPAMSPQQAEPVGPLNDFERSHLSTEDIMGLQEALGLPQPSVSGQLDASTRVAIRRWQISHSFPANGELSDTQVKAILYP